MDGGNTARLVQQADDIIRRGSKSFAAATRLFPPHLRRDVVLLYTWCRHCDDLIDGQELGAGAISTASRETLENLRAQSLAALQGAASGQLPFQALADLAQRHPLDQALIEAHLAGFELDVVGWEPQSLDDTLKYCYHTAGTVGIMMARLMAVSDAQTLCRASDLGIAFQLTNIARDVVEDARAGRSYLPAAWRDQAGLGIADLAAPERRGQVFPLVRRLIGEAEPYYHSAATGVRELPRRAAWAVGTARSVYRDIGHKIVRLGPRALDRRIYTGRGRKFWRMATALPGAMAARGQQHATRSRNGLWTPPEIA